MSLIQYSLFSKCSSSPQQTKCRACASGYALANNQQCIPMMTTIPNCEYPQLNQQYELQCYRCKDNYIRSYDKKVCTKQTITITSCSYQQYLTPLTTSKVCQICSSSTILTVNANQCLALPVGTTTVFPNNCFRAYQLADRSVKCQVCINVHSLYLNGSCTSVASEQPKRITKCVSYYQQTTGVFRCNFCVSGYLRMPDHSACLPYTQVQTINNLCTRYNYNQLAVTCLSCKSGYRLNTALNTCQALTSPYPILNCLQTVYTNSLYTCSACNTGYVLLNNQCYLSNSIANCQTYSYNTNLNCQTCNNGYFLSADKLSCSTIANCYQFIIDESVDPRKITCAECLTGYSLQNNGDTCA